MDEIEAKFSDPQSELEHMLSEMQQGYRCQIKRVEPEWCNGILGTFEFDINEPISTEWICNKFGGRKLQIKILNSQGDYVGARTIVFPESPKKDGAEIIPGPHGSPILASQAVQPPPPQSQDNGMVGVLEKIMEMQAANAIQMQTMLLGRVQSLETLLAEKLATPAAPVNPNAYDPNLQLKTTLETMAMIEQLKANVTGGEVQDDENPFVSKILEKLVEKFTDDKNLQMSPLTPPLPERQEPTNGELVKMVKTRLSGMDPKEREFLVSQVLDDDMLQVDIERDDEFVPVHPDQLPLESLLTQEDEKALNGSKETQKNASGAD